MRNERVVELSGFDTTNFRMPPDYYLQLSSIVIPRPDSTNDVMVFVDQM